jgi:hypothetical protein
MDKYGSVPGKIKNFFLSRNPPGLHLNPTNVLFQRVLDNLSLAVKQTGHLAQHLATFSAELENVWNYAPTSQYP